MFDIKNALIFKLYTILVTDNICSCWHMVLTLSVCHYLSVLCMAVILLMAEFGDSISVWIRVLHQY